MDGSYGKQESIQQIIVAHIAVLHIYLTTVGSCCRRFRMVSMLSHTARTGNMHRPRMKSPLKKKKGEAFIGTSESGASIGENGMYMHQCYVMLEFKGRALIGDRKCLQ